jgi:hypothetical protein
VIVDIVDGDPLIKWLQHALDEVLTLCTNSCHLGDVKGVGSPPDGSHDLVAVLAVEGWDCGDENVENDASRPYIAVFIIVALDDFWGNVVALRR